ncbi:E3 ubiquitin-protein ligase TRIM33-like, partial [Anneissia japonica]|uniref:E3 ubiquitin-protein ligase TRIM33-like n=1 Tax=Anneissia japonica TaxID=1529436 RepID=UPI00142568CF
ICFKRLQNPKSLNCLHSFCLTCLEDWVKEKAKLTCPTCSKLFPIPEGGLEKLPPNTFLNNLLETIERFSVRDQMKCSVCEKDEQVKYYCQDCRQYLCSTCSDYHKKFKLFANHKIHLMEDVQSMSPSQMTLLHPPLCSHHSKPLEFYCTDCKTPICVNCTIVDHNAWDGKHKSINISDAFQTFKETSATLKKSAQHFVNKLEDGLKAVIQNATKVDQCKDTCLRDIDNHVEEIFKKVKENRDKMKNEVETIYKRKKKVNDVQMDEFKAILSDIKTKLSFLNQLLKSDEGTAMQSSETVVTALRDRINELPKTEPDDNGEIYYFINKQQMTSLRQCAIGTVKDLRAADCLTLKGEESVSKDQTII